MRKTAFPPQYTHATTHNYILQMIKQATTRARVVVYVIRILKKEQKRERLKKKKEE